VVTVGHASGNEAEINSPLASRTPLGHDTRSGPTFHGNVSRFHHGEPTDRVSSGTSEMALGQAEILHC
jgi:hypothetical protein